MKELATTTSPGITPTPNGQGMNSDSYTWKAPVRPLAVRFRTRVMEAIEREVIEGFKALPKRGAEVGGLLLGRVEDGKPAMVVVEDFEPVLCEYRFGPSFHVSETDRQTLEESLSWFRGGSHAGLAVVGFYRSHTRYGFFWSEEDQKLFSTYLPDVRNVFLLIKPLRIGHSVADFSAWDHGKLIELSTPSRFPFGLPPIDEGETLRAEPIELEAAPQVHAVVSPAQQHVEPVPPPEKPVQVASSPVQVARPSPVQAPLGPSVQAPPAPPIQPPLASPGERVHRAWLAFPPPGRHPAVRWLWPGLTALLFVLGAILAYTALRGDAAAPNESSRIPASTPPVQSTSQTSPIPPEPEPQKPPLPASAAPPPALDTQARSRVSAPDSSNAAAPVITAQDRAVKNQVQAFLSEWVNALKDGDAQAYVDCYAPTLSTYFIRHNVSNAEVRKSVDQMLKRYGRLDIYKISDLQVTPAGRGKAIATFRKHWQTAGRKKFAGEERERLTLAKVDGTWEITSEEEQKLFWVHKER